MYVSTNAGRRVVGQIELPDALRPLSGLARIDYSDCFVAQVDANSDRTPLGWARAILEDAPLSFRRTAPWVWLALGLKHGPSDSDGFVLGWGIRRDDPGVALLGARSRIGMPAELLVRRERSELLFATLIEHDNSAVRAVWAGVTPYHQRVVAQLVERAASRMPA